MNTRMQSTRPARSAGSNVSQGRDPETHTAVDILPAVHLAPDVTSRRAIIRMGLDEGLLKTDLINVYEQRCRSRYLRGYSVSGVESRHAKQVAATNAQGDCNPLGLHTGNGKVEPGHREKIASRSSARPHAVTFGAFI